ncbi:class I SAM-dependent methyltransferase [Halobacterium zhouii]|uniref:class I SAM-dependent methyltransferase n=1 Tax=Halobacterium zhouii TaxID=2902624 RepID=UPI001E52497C|nr:class I SAM-dependent methyltransferase [Halobacterium zhouii]
MDSEDVRHEWAERSGEYSPRYYAYYGPNETSETVRRTVAEFADSDPSVLELGCSSGRHLSHLYDNGFEDLAGVDINADAFDVMADAYPDLASAGEFHCADIQDAASGFDDDAFDVVYSVETLQHVHPDDAATFDELARITGDLLVTVENEGDTGLDEPPEQDVNYVRDDVPLFYRDWNRVFTGRGFREVEVTQSGRDTARVFRTDDH